MIMAYCARGVPPPGEFVCVRACIALCCMVHHCTIMCNLHGNVSVSYQWIKLSSLPLELQPSAQCLDHRSGAPCSILRPRMRVLHNHAGSQSFICQRKVLRTAHACESRCLSSFICTTTDLHSNAFSMAAQSSSGAHQKIIHVFKRANLLTSCRLQA